MIHTLWTVWTSPVVITDTCSGLKVVTAMFWTSRQALVHLLINSTAVGALPSSFTVALPSNTGSMAWAAGVGAVHCKLTANHVVLKSTWLSVKKLCYVNYIVKSVVLTVVRMKTALLWDITLCRLVQIMWNMLF